jgi:hypothetical protein
MQRDNDMEASPLSSYDDEKRGGNVKLEKINGV